MTERTNPAPSFSPRFAGRLTVAIVGGGPRAASLLRLLSEMEDVYVGALVADGVRAPAKRLAEEMGVFATSSISGIHRVEGLDLVIDMSGDPSVSAVLGAGLPPGVEIIGEAGSELIWDLLVAKKRGQEQERLYTELQEAYEKIRSQERRLRASKTALEDANAELETRLAEIFFTHEFFKALTKYTSVEDVCSLIVDGLNGVLGAEISCVYLLRREDWTLRLRASQGRPDEAFRPVVPVGETILGRAFSAEAVQESDISPTSPSAAWIRPAEGIRSQAAVPLASGETVFGVMVTASTTSSAYSEQAMARLRVLGNQSSLSLQNALLLDELERLSVTDRLTQLYNHAYLHQRLDEEINRAERFGHQLSLVMVDIDEFKQFNDTYGHPRGDEMLRAVSAIVRSALREIDIAARYGGEEFVVVLPETGRRGAAEVAERIRSDVDSLHIPVGHDERAGCTVSVGVATFPLHATHGRGLVEAADQAMYRAKRGGKNRVEAASD